MTGAACCKQLTQGNKFEIQVQGESLGIFWGERG